MKKPIDFDELFNGYFAEWYAANSGRDADELEAGMPEVYEAFLKRPNCALGGKTPAEYFGGMTGEELFAELKGYLAAGVPLPDVLLGELAKAPGAERLLAAELEHGCGPELAAVCMNLLEELDSSLAFSLYADWILDPQRDEGVRELAVEILSGRGGGGMCEKLLDGVARASEDTRLLIADVVVADRGNERAFRLLCSLFRTVDDVALAASYLAKFGDDRALPFLREELKREDLNYAEFIELRNSIEALGGEVEDCAPRDFENDPTYRAIKFSK